MKTKNILFFFVSIGFFMNMNSVCFGKELYDPVLTPMKPYYEAFGYKTEEEYLDHAGGADSVIVFDTVDNLMVDKLYSIEDRNDVYKYFEKYKPIYFGSGKTIRSFSGVILDDIIDVISNDIDVKFNEIYSLKIKYKKDKNNTQVRAELKEKGKQLLGLYRLLGSHMGACDDKNNHTCLILRNRNQTSISYKDKGKSQKIEMLFNESGSVYNLYFNKPEDDLYIIDKRGYSQSEFYGIVIVPFIESIESIKANKNLSDSIRKESKQNLINWFLEKSKNIIKEGKETELRKFLENEISLVEKSGKASSTMLLKTNKFFTNKMQVALKKELNKVSDIEERMFFIGNIIKKIDKKMEKETKFETRELLKEINKFLKDEHTKLYEAVTQSNKS